MSKLDEKQVNESSTVPGSGAAAAAAAAGAAAGAADPPPALPPQGTLSSFARPANIT